MKKKYTGFDMSIAWAVITAVGYMHGDTWAIILGGIMLSLLAAFEGLDLTERYLNKKLEILKKEID